jgi:hypothetical protein
MKSASPGDDTSQVEVSGISPHGIWLFLGAQELFLPFKDFPWFRDAPVAGVLKVERPEPHHLYWPDLDIDLAVESITHPERYPLISRERPRKGSPPSKPGRASGRANPRASSPSSRRGGAPAQKRLPSGLRRGRSKET